MSTPEKPGMPIAAEDQARADLYALLAAMLLHAPTPALLAALAAVDSLPAPEAGSALDTAWEQLAAASAVTDAGSAQTEFDALFVSVGTPQINPYASRYLAGFMMEKPLAALRDDLRMLGLSRVESCRELEDHLGALCESMRLLVSGTIGLPAQALAQQKTFFLKHIAPWYARCCDDIRCARGVSFYKHVADFAQAFFDVERAAFDIDERPDETDDPDPLPLEKQHA